MGRLDQPLLLAQVSLKLRSCLLLLFAIEIHAELTITNKARQHVVRRSARRYWSFVHQRLLCQ